MGQQSAKDKAELAFVRSMFVTLLRQDQQSFLPTYLLDEKSSSVSGIPNQNILGLSAPPAEVKNWLRTSFSQTRSDQDVMVIVNQAVSAFKGLLKNSDTSGLDFSTLSQSFLDILETRSEWEFDLFALFEASGENLKLTGVALVTKIFEDWGFFDKFDIRKQKLGRFVETVLDHYRANPYHCGIHALDVMQTVHYMLKAGLKKCLSDLQTLALIVAAFVHDVDHDGLSNLYHTRSYSSRALMHNDLSPQENHHLVTAFTILKKPSTNIFASLDGASYSLVRSLMIRSVLFSDMSQHFKLLENLKTLTEEKGMKDISSYDQKDLELICSLALHAADISNPGKPFPIAKAWTRRVMTEFFNQGDKERERDYPISPMCDRTKPAVPDSQCGFIKFVVRPTFVFLVSIVPELEKSVVVHLDKNFDLWSDLRSKTLEELDALGVMPENSVDLSNEKEEDEKKEAVDNEKKENEKNDGDKEKGEGEKKKEGVE